MSITINVCGMESNVERAFCSRAYITCVQLYNPRERSKCNNMKSDSVLIVIETSLTRDVRDDERGAPSRAIRYFPL